MERIWRYSGQEKFCFKHGWDNIQKWDFSRLCLKTWSGHVLVSLYVLAPLISHAFEYLIPAFLSQNFSNKSCLVCFKCEKYASLVTLRPQWDRYRRGKAEVRILDFKTTWSEFQMPSQTAPAEAKPRCVYSNLKPHGQSFITSPESVQSSCVR